LKYVYASTVPGLANLVQVAPPSFDSWISGRSQERSDSGSPFGLSHLASDLGFLHALGVGSCGIDPDDVGWCWGDNVTGQLGTGDRIDALQPQPIPGGQAWTVLDAGALHSCGITTGARLYCWGSNGSSQLGIGIDPESLVPRLVNLEWWRLVVTELTHTCALTVGGLRYCWGKNSAGELGLGHTTDRTIPTNLNGDGAWWTLALGGKHTCGIRSVDQSLHCWGRQRGRAAGHRRHPLSASKPQPVS
jgi:alpha-tubulin suppressor-like RCC1 family protein